jgi:hypothetical protein
MNFCNGFLKVAGAKKGLTERIADVLAEGVEAGKSFGKGIHATGKHTLGDTLKLKGLSHINDAATKNKGYLEAFKSKHGRKAMAEALGKAMPSVGAAGLYAGLGYKGYKKFVAPDSQQYYGYY